MEKKLTTSGAFACWALALLLSVSASAAPAGLEEVTIAELQQRMASGKDTARSLAQKYLRRIAEVDRGGAGLHSVIELNPEALDIADRLDAERRRKGPRGPLHGIPVLLKDNIATADRMATSAGSLALAGAPAPRDADLVARLREAGAVILGKTNLSEWANFRSTHSVSGWSGRGGLTKNPYALDRNPSGSSSGSAVAVAANLCAVAVGTETDGSIVSPASACGVVGIKPTVGLIGGAGIVPIAHSQDTAGPMARTVRDAAILLEVLAGPSAHDYVRGLGAGADGLRGARLGVMAKLLGASPAADRIFAAALAEMKRHGAVIVEHAEEPAPKLDEDELEVLLYEFKADLDRYLAGLGPGVKVHSLADVIRFNQQHAAQEMPYFGQELLTKAQAKGPLSSPAYLQAEERLRRLSRKEGIDQVMDRYRLDALVGPTRGPAIPSDLVNGDQEGGPSSSTLPAVAGYPHITVPAGQAFGLPVGVSFIGRAMSEPVLLRLAYAFEQATLHRRPPRLPPTADLSRP